MKHKILFFEGNIDGTVGGSYFLMYDLVIGLDKQKYTPVVGFHTDNFLVQKLRDRGIETFIFDRPKPFSFGFKPLDILLFPLKRLINFFKRMLIPALQYKNFIRKNHIDMVNVNNSIMRNHAWMIAAKMAGIRCVTHEMGINPKFTYTARFLGKRLDAIICLSYVIRDNMTKNGIEYPNIHVIHCGIDPDRYHIKETPEELRKKYNVDNGSLITGVVGNVKFWKGQETIVRAMAELVKSYKNLKCFLVGATPDEPYQKKLLSFIKENGIEDNIIFTGFQENGIDYMNLMDVVVHTSVEPEPFGIVTLEAMSLSKPLVSTTIGGPAEVVINGKTGLLVDPGKPNLLAEAIDKLLRDPASAKTMGEEGYKRLQSDFTFEKNIKLTTKVYDDIFGNTV